MAIFGLEEFGDERMRIVASWDIAARIVGIDPESRVYEYHPGGGSYDCLAIGRDGLHIDINRNGSIHVHKSAGGAAMGLLKLEEWTRAVSGAHGTSPIAEAITQHCLLNQDKGPSRGPWPLTYQVIARVLASRVFDSALWDCRLQAEDSAGLHSEPDPRFAPPSLEASSISPTEFWAIMRNEEPVAYLWNGWAWNPSGERISLAARFARGDSIDMLTAALTHRTGSKASTPIPVPQVDVTAPTWLKPPMFRD